MEKIDNLFKGNPNLCAQIISQIPDMFALFDKTHRVIYSNNYTAKVVGYRHEEQLLGITAFDMRCPAAESAPEFKYQDQIVFTTAQTLAILDMHQYAQGEHKILFTKKSPFMVQNQIHGLLCRSTEVHSKALARFCSILTQLDSKYYDPKCKRGRSYLIGRDINKIKLTSREEECLFCILRNKTAKKIAETLQLSHRTVEWHLDNINKKFNCSSRMDMIDAALAAGYLGFIPKSLFSRNISEILS